MNDLPACSFLNVPTPPTGPGLTKGYPTTLSWSILGMIDLKLFQLDSNGLKKINAGALGLLEFKPYHNYVM
jgi:hypothetical protein